jgi:hypothetical protein
MTVNEKGEKSVKFVLGNVQGIHIGGHLGVEGGPLQIGLYIAFILQYV